MSERTSGQSGQSGTGPVRMSRAQSAWKPSAQPKSAFAAPAASASSPRSPLHPFSLHHHLTQNQHDRPHAFLDPLQARQRHQQLDRRSGPGWSAPRPPRPVRLGLWLAHRCVLSCGRARILLYCTVRVYRAGADVLTLRTRPPPRSAVRQPAPHRNPIAPSAPAPALARPLARTPRRALVGCARRLDRRHVGRVLLHGRQPAQSPGASPPLSLLRFLRVADGWTCSLRSA